MRVCMCVCDLKVPLVGDDFENRQPRGTMADHFCGNITYLHSQTWDTPPVEPRQMFFPGSPCGTSKAYITQDDMGNKCVLCINWAEFHIACLGIMSV